MKKYGNDYRQRGKQFEYTGKWYGSSLSVKELKRHALNNTGLMAAALVIYFASLMLNNEGSRIFWILLPYMVVVFPVSYGIMGGASLFLFCRQQATASRCCPCVPRGRCAAPYPPDARECRGDAPPGPFLCVYARAQHARRAEQHMELYADVGDKRHLTL